MSGGNPTRIEHSPLPSPNRSEAQPIWRRHLGVLSGQLLARTQATGSTCILSAGLREHQRPRKRNAGNLHTAASVPSRSPQETKRLHAASASRPPYVPLVLGGIGGTGISYREIPRRWPWTAAQLFVND